MDERCKEFASRTPAALRDQAVGKKFTKRHSSLYIQAMELVRLGDTSAAASDKLAVLFKENLATMAPFEETRDGLGLEDRPSTRAPCEGCSKRTRFCSICKKPSHK